MKPNDLLDRTADLAKAQPPDGPCVPPPEVIAVNVRMTRHLMNLKKSALAHMAGVSLSTVERVENAERVSEDSLDRIAVALGEQPGYFTAPRMVRAGRDAAADFVDRFGQLEVVRVGHLTRQGQVRALAACHAYVVNAPALDDLRKDIAGLVEWLDLAAFVAGPFAPRRNGDGRRKLYADVLKVAAEVEGKGVTVLAGVMPLPEPDFPDWKVAIFNITRKATDPGAIKRRHVFVDRRSLSRSRATG